MCDTVVCSFLFLFTTSQIWLIFGEHWIYVTVLHRIFKLWSYFNIFGRQEAGRVSLYMYDYIEYFDFFLQNFWLDLTCILQRWSVRLVTLYQDCLNTDDISKTWWPGGGGQLFKYMYDHIENFKTLVQMNLAEMEP